MASDLPHSVLVVGAGGREHTLVRSLLRSPTRPRVICAPGNAGIAADVACFPVAVDDLEGMVALAQREHVDFVVVGPDLAIALGTVDKMLAAGIPAFGAKADGGRLEASKTYAKQVMRKYGIPTAPAEFFTEAKAALAYLKTRQAPIVIKADGLAAGKGVVVAQTIAEAEQAVRDMLEGGRFGASGHQILIEDCLVGDETSVLVVVSGRDYVILPTSQDHKRIGDGDTGPNTGGMGTYSPAEWITPAMLERIDREIVRPSVEAIAAEGIDFRGTLFVGLMITAEGPRVIEYNARFGDPETQVVLPRIANDVLELLWLAAQRKLAGYKLRVKPEHAICVVVATRGYPDAFPKGDVITLPPLSSSVEIIHAGTGRNAAGQLTANGGRVLGVVAMKPTLAQAAREAYATCEALQWTTKYYRRDIGARQLGGAKS